MVQKRRKRKSTKSKKQNQTVLFFTLFIAIALASVVLLEYIDYRKGKESFIFTRLIPLQPRGMTQAMQFNKDFSRILSKNNIPFNYFRDTKEQEIFRFKIEVKNSRFKGLLKQMNKVAATLKGSVKLLEVQGLLQKSIYVYTVNLNKKLTHKILITRLKKGLAVKEKQPEPDAMAEKKEEKPEKKPAKPEAGEAPFSGTPRIAIIIDDIGAYDIGAFELKKLNIPITASILPHSPHAYDESKWCREYGLQTMLHIPMQPMNGNGPSYGSSNTISIRSTDAEIRTLIRKAKQIAPSARGVNNHQGSRATANRELMTRVLKIIKEENLFFVDSRTIGNTVAFQVAKELGVKTTYKDIFIDHIKSYSHSMSQIRRLVEVALKKGQAIAIGHPNSSTLKALRDSIPYIRSKGIKIVYVSHLLE